MDGEGDDSSEGMFGRGFAAALALKDRLVQYDLESVEVAALHVENCVLARAAPLSPLTFIAVACSFVRLSSHHGCCRSFICFPFELLQIFISFLPCISQRHAVYDDESDYFTSSAWLNELETEELQKRDAAR
jgi:hypothetical protein